MSRALGATAFDVVVSHCACGRDYTKGEWGELEYVGLIPAVPEVKEPAIELRNCRCGSTIGVEVKP
jgi:hypothetical protein